MKSINIKISISLFKRKPLPMFPLKSGQRGYGWDDDGEIAYKMTFLKMDGKRFACRFGKGICNHKYFTPILKCTGKKNESPRST